MSVSTVGVVQFLGWIFTPCAFKDKEIIISIKILIVSLMFKY
jgi:hypothetical protein